MKILSLIILVFATGWAACTYANQPATSASAITAAAATLGLHEAMIQADGMQVELNDPQFTYCEIEARNRTFTYYARSGYGVTCHVIAGEIVTVRGNELRIQGDDTAYSVWHIRAAQ